MSVNGVLAYGTLFSSARMLIGATSAIYLLSRGLSLGELGTLKALQAAAVFVLDVPTSYLADKIGRRWSVLVSVALGAIWMAMTGLAQDKVWLYAAELANALSICFNNGAFVALLVESQKRANPDAPVRAVMGRWGLLQTVGMAAGALIGTLIAGPESRLPWFIGAAVLALQLVLLTKLLPPDPKRQATPTPTFEERFAAVRAVIGGLKINAHVTGLSLIAVGTFYQVLLQFWQPMASGALNSLPSYYYGLLFVAILLSQALGAAVLGRLRSAMSAALLSTGGLALSAALLWLGTSNSQSVLIPASLICFFGFLKIATLSAQSELHEILPSANRATLESGYTTIMRFVVFLSLPMTGLALLKFGPNIMAVATLVVGTIWLGSFWYLSRGIRSESEVAQVGSGEGR